MGVFERLETIGFPRVNLFDRETYLRNLKFMHALMVASEPLVQDAIDHSSGVLNAYLTEHIEEERGHAAWLAEDIRSMGAKPETDMIAAACAGAQYYLIRHINPEALLGYMAVLECYPMQIEMVEALEQAHGKEAVRTLRYHAEHDIDHRKALMAMIEKSEHQQLIGDNAVQTLNLLNIALR